jgi:hypothetical protein
MVRVVKKRAVAIRDARLSVAHLPPGFRAVREQRRRRGGVFFSFLKTKNGVVEWLRDV